MDSRNKKGQFIKGSQPFHTGKPLPDSWKKSLREGWIKRKEKGLGHPTLGIPLSLEHRKKLSIARKNNPVGYWKGKKRVEMQGENNPNWKGGISKERWRNKHTLKDPQYVAWRKTIFERDGYSCKINNQDCGGLIQAHHILRWSEYVELRYEINNGITLCQAHHPRKRAEEKRLAPHFRELVSVSK